LDDTGICFVAIKIGTSRWDYSDNYSLYVSEANRRGLSEQDCLRLNNKTFPKQANAGNPQTRSEEAFRRNIPSNSRGTNVTAGLADVALCTIAIHKRTARWDGAFPNEMIQAMSRGLTEQQCARMTGRFSQQQIAAVYRGSPSATNPPAVTPRREPKEIAKGAPTRPRPTRRVQISTGSGFFVSKSGHVVTNAHVIKGCNRITVGDNANTQTGATLVASDRRNDLALLKLGSLEMASAETKSLIKKLGIKVVPLVAHGLLRSDDVELGESVLVAGFPYGELYSNTIKVTGGMVSAVRGIADDSGQFQMDAAAQAGNSGGPIYDANGNIVGVVVAQLNKFKVAKATGALPENVNFGIKASTVRQFLTSSGLPSKWSTRTKKMSTTELAKIAQRQTLMVICHK
jgi:S1-C subfamily serine protease